MVYFPDIDCHLFNFGILVYSNRSNRRSKIFPLSAKALVVASMWSRRCANRLSRLAFALALGLAVFGHHLVIGIGLRASVQQLLSSYDLTCIKRPLAASQASMPIPFHRAEFPSESTVAVWAVCLQADPPTLGRFFWVDEAAFIWARV